MSKLRSVISHEAWQNIQSDIPNQIIDRESFDRMVGLFDSLGAWDDIQIHEGYPMILKASKRQLFSTRSITRREVEEICRLLNQNEEGVYSDVLNGQQFDPGYSTLSADRRFESRFRIHIGAADSGEGRQGARLTIRSIKQESPTISDVGLTPEQVLRLFPLTGGVLVGGETGSGKNTTLAAAIHHIIANSGFINDRVILEGASPIEYSYRPLLLQHTNRNVHVIQEQHKRDFAKWSDFIEGALRSNPDTIIISELRDYETIDQALLAAGSGHHLIGTVHTKTPVGAFNRLLKVYPESQKNRVLGEMSENIKVMMNQRLVDAVGGGVRAIRAWLEITADVKRDLIKCTPAEVARVLNDHYISQGETFSDDAKRLLSLGEITEDTANKMIRDEQLFMETE
ncbi:ATPase, T2SS/T4P/T4SS family [Reinekea sp. G2M2-21]|uniref:ATPase, T2SS/T4P/T4SS family n=1 Tax=Reinekea sp. G2M2-21 TaxID=2788942 RepID=UPI0018AA3ABE|nr:ATPase, T2SS/T4P/T4SS family [Reinekea sp. G2M2-21]